MELDHCFFCKEPLKKSAILNDIYESSEFFRQQHAQSLIRLFSFIHKYSAADGGASKPQPGLPLPLEDLEERLQGVKYCKKCTGSLRQLVQAFKTYDDLGRKLEGYKSHWIGRLEQSHSCSSRSSAVGGTNSHLRMRKEFLEVAEAPAALRCKRRGGDSLGGAPFLKLKRLEQIPELARYINQNLATRGRPETEITIKEEPMDPELCSGPSSPAENHYQEVGDNSDSEYEPPENDLKPSKSNKSRRSSAKIASRQQQRLARTALKCKSVKRLTHLRQHSCDYPGCWLVLQTFAELEEHVNSVHASEPRPWTCDKEHAPSIPCTAAFFQEASLLQHIYYVHSTRFKHPCPKCLQGFDDYRPFERHQKRDHHQVVGVRGKPIRQQRTRSKVSNPPPERPSLVSDSRNPLLLPYFPCDFVGEGCEFRGRDEWETQRHVTLQHPNAERPHICGEVDSSCGARFVTEHRLARHKHWTHSGARYPCQDCDFVCEFAEKSARHRLRVHGKGLLCPHPGCDYKAISNAKLRAHLESSVHASSPDDPGLRKHMCQHCGRKFMSNESVGRHIHSKHPETMDQEEREKFKCLCCAKILQSAPLLREHIKSVHEQEFKFHCEKCGRGFRIESRLRAHMRVHLKPHEFEYQCTVCGAKFRQKTILNSHMRRHTGKFKEEHACRHCGKNFTNSHAARRHEQIHAATLEHVCPVCNKGFPIRNYLVIHMRSHETAEQKEARKKGKEEARAKLPQLCKVYFEATKKGDEVQAPFPLHYVERGPRQNLSRVLAPEELPSAANDS